MLALLTALTVLCVGDSHTDWPNSYCDMSSHTTENVAIAATTVVDWNMNWYTWGAPHLAGHDVVSVLLGGGSAFVQPPRSREAWGVEMRLLLSKIEHDNIVISSSALGLGLLPTHPYNLALPGYALEAQEIAAEMDNVTYGVDLALLGMTFDCYDDVLHPGAECHALAVPPMDEAWATSHPFSVGATSAVGLVVLSFVLCVVPALVLLDRAPVNF